MQLAKTNKLQYLSNESIKSVTKKLDLGYRYQFNMLSNKFTKDEVITQLENLFKANKLQYLAKKAVGTMDPEIIEELSNNCLLCIAKCGLTSKQAEQLTKEQFELIYKDDKSNIKPEMINGLNPDIIAKNENFLKNITSEQAENLNKKQVEAIKKNGKFDILPDNVLSIVAKKMENQLSELDTDTLTRIVKSKNEDTPIPDSKPRLNEFNTAIEFRGTLKDEEDLRSHIKGFVNSEIWLDLREFCFFQSESADQKSTIYKILNEEITSKLNDNIYALTDKVQLLLTAIMLAPNNKELCDNYKKFEETLDLLIKEPPKSIDEYFTKFDLYTSLLKDKSLNMNVRERIFEEQKKLIKEDFVYEFFDKVGRNSLDNFTRQKIVEMYLNGLNLKLEKSEIDLKKFEKELSYNEANNLSKDEKECEEFLKKIKYYEPDLESKLRQVVRDGIDVFFKTAIAYLIAKTAIKNGSTIVKIAGGAAAAYQIYGAYETADNAIKIAQYSDPFVKAAIHKKEKKDKIDRDKGLVDNVREAINHTKETTSHIIFGGRRKKSNKIPKESLTEEQRMERAKIAQNELLDAAMKKQLDSLKNRDKKNKYKRVSELLEKNKGESILEKKREQLIQDDIEIRKKALELVRSEKTNNLYKKEEYSDYEDKGILYKIRSNIGKIMNGVAEGALDVVSDYSGDAYKNSATGEIDEEKIRIEEAKYRVFAEEIAKIEIEYKEGLKKIDHRERHRLVSMNKSDKKKFEEFRKNVKNIKSNIDKKREGFRLEEPKKPDETKEVNKFEPEKRRELVEVKETNEFKPEEHKKPDETEYNSKNTLEEYESIDISDCDDLSLPDDADMSDSDLFLSEDNSQDNSLLTLKSNNWTERFGKGGKGQTSKTFMEKINEQSKGEQSLNRQFS